MRRSALRLMVAATAFWAALVLAPSASAVGTPAGVSITNQATVSFTDANGNPLQSLSNVVTTVVSQVGGLTVDPDRASTASPGDVVTYAHVVTNTGNGNDTIELSLVDSNGWAATLYRDVNGNQTYEPGVDTLLSDTNGSGGVDTGVLAHDAQLAILVRLTVPAGVANAVVDSLVVTGRSVFDGTRNDTAVDTTTIAAPVLSVVKSVLPAGAQPPGTVLTYTITVTNNGNGVAQNAVLTDPAPTNTTYVAGSITYNGAGRTDSADGDNADFGISNANTVTVQVGSLAAGGGSATVTFQVSID